MNKRHQQKRQVYLSEAAGKTKGATVPFSRAKTEHLRKVLRLEVGQEIRVADGCGRLFDAVLQRHAGSDLAAELTSLVREDAKPADTTLILGLPKNNTMDWCVEKAVECGVTRILSVSTARSVVKPDSDELEKYARRWRLIAEGAMEQSERTWDVAIEEPLLWDDFLALARKERLADQQIAFFSEGRDFLEDSDSALAKLWDSFGTPTRQTSVAVMVGPEGGFIETEREALKEAGFAPGSFGKEVLRVETAVIAALWCARLRRAVV